jgi:hypothetical protein
MEKYRVPLSIVIFAIIVFIFLEYLKNILMAISILLFILLVLTGIAGIVFLRIFEPKDDFDEGFKHP